MRPVLLFAPSPDAVQPDHDNTTAMGSPSQALFPVHTTTPVGAFPVIGSGNPEGPTPAVYVGFNTHSGVNCRDFARALAVYADTDFGPAELI